MDLKALKATLDAAAKKLEAKPDDADLKAAHAEAKSAYETALAEEDDDEEEEDEEEDPPSGKKGDKKKKDDELDESGLDDKTKAYIKKLRRENGKGRIQNKNLNDRLTKLETGLKSALGGDDDDDAPTEEKVKGLKNKNEALGFKTAVLEAALEHGVGKDDREYFEFLVSKKLTTLEEGEELSEDDLAELAKASRKKSGGSGGTRTSVDDDDAPNPKKSGKVTLDQFAKMTITEKTALFTSNRALYDQLFAEAKEKRRL